MSKRLIALLMALSLIAVVFAGCTPTEAPVAPAAPEAAAEEPGEDEALADPAAFVLDLALRENNPELFLEGALTLSGLNASGAFIDLAPDFSAFDLSRFRGSPTEHRFSFSIDEADPDIIPIDGVGIDLSFLSNEAASSYLLNFAIDAGFLAFEDNRIFISPDMIALSFPDLYDRHQYISINPQTFAQDWNASDFADAFGEIDPSDFDIVLAMIEEMSDMMSFGSLLEMLEEYEEQFERVSENFMSAGTFVDEGNTEITVGNNTYTVARLGYTFSEAAVVEYMDAIMDVVFDVLFDFIDGIIAIAAIADPTLDVDEIREEMQEVFEEMNSSFPYGMVLFYYIDVNTGLVRRSHIPDWTMVMDAGFGEEESITDIVTYYLGEVSPADVTRTYVTMTDGFGDVTEMEMFMSIPEGGPYVFSMDMTSTALDGVISFEMGYNPNASTDNVWLEIEYRERFVRGVLEMRGDLVDSANEFAINNGQMTLSLNGTSVMDASFEYSLRNVAAGDVNIDRAQATSLFEIDLDQLEQDLMMLMLMMSMM